MSLASFRKDLSARLVGQKGSKELDVGFRVYTLKGILRSKAGSKFRLGSPSFPRSKITAFFNPSCRENRSVEPFSELERLTRDNVAMLRAVIVTKTFRKNRAVRGYYERERERTGTSSCS